MATTRIRGPNPPIAPQLELERRWGLIASTEWSLIATELMPVYGREFSARGGSSELPASISTALSTMQRELTKSVPKRSLRAAASRASRAVEATNGAAYARQLSASLGSAVRVEPNGKAEIIVGHVGSATDRATAIRRGAIPALRAAVEDAWARGRPADALMRGWQRHGLPLARGTVEGQTKLAARGELAMLNGELNKARQKAMGESSYRWRISALPNVRPLHRGRHGRRFFWRRPPSDGHPGQPRGCRCTAEALVDLKKVVHEPEVVGAVPERASTRLERFAVPQVRVSAGAAAALARVAPEASEDRRRQLAAALISARPRDVVGAVSVRDVRGKIFINASLRGGGEASRTLRKGDDGQWFVVNSNFALGKTGYPKGYGTRSLARQVEALRELGIDRIVTLAAGGRDAPDLNGFYTWPRLGFDGPIPDASIEELPSALSRTLGSPALVSELMASAQGRAWWRANGRSFDATFDTRPGSRSSRVLDAYIRERGL